MPSSDAERPAGELQARARLLRRRVAVAAVGAVVLSWNAVDVLGAQGGPSAFASPTVGHSSNGSIDITAPVTTRQS